MRNPWFGAILAVLIGLGIGAPAMAHTCDPTKNCCPSAWGSTSPFDPRNAVLYDLPSSPDECEFHNYSWETFVAVTEDKRFLTMVRDVDLFRPQGFSPKYYTGEPFPPYLATVHKDMVQASTHFPLYGQNGKEVLYGLRYYLFESDFIAGKAQLYEETAFCHTALAGGVSLPYGSIEIKTAWLPVESCSPTKYVCSNEHDGTPLALVGMHIVSKPLGQPDWVWATFEHVDNAPDCDDVTGGKKSVKAWTFFPLDTTCKTVCLDGSCTKNECDNCCNYYPPDKAKTGTYNSSICRAIKIGENGGTINGSKVKSLNYWVQKKLKTEAPVPSLQVLQNYELVGTTWVPPGQTKAAGSFWLTNTTLESYVQQAPGGKSGPFNINCLTCHTSDVSTKYSKTTPNGGNPGCNNKIDRSFAFNRIRNWPDGFTCGSPPSKSKPCQ